MNLSALVLYYYLYLSKVRAWAFLSTLCNLNRAGKCWSCVYFTRASKGRLSRRTWDIQTYSWPSWLCDLLACRRIMLFLQQSKLKVRQRQQLTFLLVLTHRLFVCKMSWLPLRERSTCCSAQIDGINSSFGSLERKSVASFPCNWPATG